MLRMDWLQTWFVSLVGNRTGAIESMRKFRFIGKILVPNKYKEVTLRHEELPAHSILATDAQGPHQLARQLLYVGSPFHAQNSPLVLSLPRFPGGICSTQKATLML